MARIYTMHPYNHLVDSGREAMTEPQVAYWNIIPYAYKKYMEKFPTKTSHLDVSEALMRVCDGDVYNSDAVNWIDNVYNINTITTPEYNPNMPQFKHLYQNVTLSLSAGNGATVTVVDMGNQTKMPFYINGHQVTTGCLVQANGKSYMLPKANITKTHNLTMLYAYTIKEAEELAKTGQDTTAQKQIIEMCEKNLEMMAKGQNVDFDILDYVSKEKFEHIQNLSEIDAYQKCLVHNNLIPSQTESFVYPNEIYNFEKFIDKIIPAYSKANKNLTPKIERLGKELHRDLYINQKPKEDYEFADSNFTAQDYLDAKLSGDQFRVNASRWSGYDMGTTNKQANLLVGKYSKIIINQNEKMKVLLGNGKTMELPKNLNLGELVNALRLLEIVEASLKKDPNNKLLQTYHHDIMMRLENCQNGKSSAIGYPKAHYDNSISSKVEILAKYAQCQVFQSRLIAQGRLPKDTNYNFRANKNFVSDLRKIELKNNENNFDINQTNSL